MRRLLNRRRTATSVGWENLTATEGEHPEIIELYVVVMGPSDLDKAKFIDEATGSTNRIRDPRHTCPISEAYTVPGNPDTTIYRLIHFPSFNFRVQSPVDTLSAISAACRTIGHDQVGGLIYLVNVKDVRAKKDRYCNFLFAREICAAASWVIATTGWNDSVGWNDEVGLDDAIRDITYGQPGDDVYFEEMSPGSQCLKHDGGRETAIGISQCVWKTPGSLRMRRELLEKPLSGTSAARLLQNIIVNRVAQLVKSICEARQRSQEAARRGDMEKLNRQIMKEAAERKRLEIPLSEIPKLWMTDEEAQSLLQPLPDPLPHNGPDGAPITVEILAWYAERLITELWLARERFQESQKQLAEADGAQQTSVLVLLEEMRRLGAKNDELQSLRAALPAPLRLLSTAAPAVQEAGSMKQQTQDSARAESNEDALVAEVTRLRQQAMNHQDEHVRMVLQEERYKARIAALEEQLEQASRDFTSALDTLEISKRNQHREDMVAGSSSSSESAWGETTVEPQ